MFTWIEANLATLLTGAAVVLILTTSIVKVVRDRIKGRSSCGFKCEHCTMNCHKQQR